jgi:hypothetical protein
MPKNIKILPGKWSKNEKPFSKLPIIWLEIILEFISKIPSQMIGKLKKRGLNTFLVKF